MKRFFKSHLVATGLAMFSMFFGAGNVIFPLLLGQYAGDKNIFVIFGLLLTAVLIPFVGLIAVVLYKGSYHEFFARIGKIPGFCIIVLSMLMIGPFGGIPRCVSLSFATFSVGWQGLSFLAFSLLSCLLIFFCTARENRVVSLLGYVLTPLLLVTLFVIIIKGFIGHAAPPAVTYSNWQVFNQGLMGGYNTLDLIASFFFSALVLNTVKSNPQFGAGSSAAKLLRFMLKASWIGAGLLTLIYIGFSFISSYHPLQLEPAQHDQLVGLIALQVLGPYSAIITDLMIGLACLTTAVALAVVFAEFLRDEIFRKKIDYLSCLIITLIITFCISLLKFMGIVKLLLPILTVLYPALLVLSICNIAYKLWGFKYVKTPFYAVLLISLACYILKSLES